MMIFEFLKFIHLKTFRNRTSTDGSDFIGFRNIENIFIEEKIQEIVFET